MEKETNKDIKASLPDTGQSKTKRTILFTLAYSTKRGKKKEKKEHCIKTLKLK